MENIVITSPLRWPNNSRFIFYLPTKYRFKTKTLNDLQPAPTINGSYIKPFSETRTISIYLNHLLPFLPFFTCATPYLTSASLFFPIFWLHFLFYLTTNCHFHHSFIQKYTKQEPLKLTSWCVCVRC